jgi:hypothetical protein
MNSSPPETHLWDSLQQLQRALPSNLIIAFTVYPYDASASIVVHAGIPQVAFPRGSLANLPHSDESKYRNLRACAQIPKKQRAFRQALARIGIFHGWSCLATNSGVWDECKVKRIQRLRGDPSMRARSSGFSSRSSARCNRPADLHRSSTNRYRLISTEVCECNHLLCKQRTKFTKLLEPTQPAKT